MIVQGGRVLREREYTEAAQLTVEIVLDSGVVQAVYLLDEPAFESNLNQMFVLGRFDPTRFEEVFNDFPYARAFRVLAAARMSGSRLRPRYRRRRRERRSTSYGVAAATQPRRGPRASR